MIALRFLFEHAINCCNLKCSGLRKKSRMNSLKLGVYSNWRKTFITNNLIYFLWHRKTFKEIARKSSVLKLKFSSTLQLTKKSFDCNHLLAIFLKY